MKCQAVCPRNKPFMNWFEDRANFSSEETDTILSQAPIEKLSETTLHKLEKSELTGENYDTLGRNLNALITNSMNLR
jgi:hypothetical protein